MTKVEQILNPNSDWNQASNDEPVFVLRALNWKAALFLITSVKGDNRTVDDILKAALAMRDYHNDNDIPF